ncbi:hypothetical protein JD844_011211 [Phrynosoma platyrhinos]|uniref:THO1-MOS11 C-terminal domain-containing protein n=1 Tax=Phrynosoma platyrhinos TaxID=52577 RepID=A0ABQ7TIJ5_PHRPL|nr:hypothetical protein JD844_011211 [Phrynosoma platyrhinos]
MKSSILHMMIVKGYHYFSKSHGQHCSIMKYIRQGRGEVVNALHDQTEEDEKLKKRKERFGIVTNSAGSGTTEDTEAKKRKRAERFGLV